MKRLIKPLAAFIVAMVVLLIIALDLAAQPGTITTSNAARRISRYATLPATCAAGEVAYQISDSTFYKCDTANTWSEWGSSLSNTLVTIDGNSTTPAIASASDWDGAGLYWTDDTLNVANNAENGGVSAANYEVLEELGTNVAPAAAAGWNTLGAGWTAADTPQAATLTATGGISTAAQASASTVTSGLTYKLIYWYTRTAGTLTPSFGGQTLTAVSAAGPVQVIEYRTATATTALTFTGSGFTGTVYGISLEPVTSGIGNDTGTLRIFSAGSIRLLPASGFGVLFPAGTAANPSIALADDADGTGTGFYRNATNTIGITVNGTVRSIIDANYYSTVTAVGWGASVATPDTILSRNADGILQLKSDGTSAASFLIDGDGSGSTNYLSLGRTADRYFLIDVGGAAAGDAFRIHNFAHPTGSSAVPDGYNIFVGAGAGNFTTGSAATTTTHGSGNIGIGRDALTNIGSGYQNIAIGSYALDTVSSGNSSVAVGVSAASSLTTHTNVTAVGNGAGAGNVASSWNAFGSTALGNASGATNTTAIGDFALAGITTGDDNVALGQSAGRKIADGTTNAQTIAQGTYLGKDTKASADAVTNETVIGHGAIGAGSNTVTLGSSSVTSTQTFGEYRVFGDGATKAKWIKVGHDGTNPIIDSSNESLIIKQNGSTKITLGATVLFGAQISGGGNAQDNFVHVVTTEADDATSLTAVSGRVHVTAGFTAARTKNALAALAGRRYTVIDNDDSHRLTLTVPSGDIYIWTDGTVIDPSDGGGTIAFGARYQSIEVLCYDATTCVVESAQSRGGAFTVTP